MQRIQGMTLDTILAFVLLPLMWAAGMYIRQRAYGNAPGRRRRHW